MTLLFLPTKEKLLLPFVKAFLQPFLKMLEIKIQVQSPCTSFSFGFGKRRKKMREAKDKLLVKTIVKIFYLVF